MKKRYLNTVFDWRTQEYANVYDELPLWSAPFGRLLLDRVPLAPNLTVLDVGFGTGFPLVDLAQRLGSTCKVYGIDSWHFAVERAKKKLEVFQVENVEVIEQDASSLQFKDQYFDLITSNLGINNFENAAQVLSECLRTLKADGKFCTTSNLTGTFHEFYEIFHQTIIEEGFTEYLPGFQKHVEHRGSVESMTNLLNSQGFTIQKKIEDSFSMRFLDGSAFLNHSFTIAGFISPWRTLFPFKVREEFFEKLEENLNAHAVQKGEFKVSIPMLYLECVKS